MSGHTPWSEIKKKTRYDAFPDHPLYGVPWEILDAARQELRDVAEWGDIPPDMIEPVADAVVIALLPWLKREK